MALTQTLIRRSHDGNSKRIVVDLLWDNAYVTAGEVLELAAELGLSEIDAILDAGTRVKATNAVDSRKLVYDAQNRKFLLFSAAGVEVTNATDLSTLATRIVVFGR